MGPSLTSTRRWSVPGLQPAHRVAGLPQTLWRALFFSAEVWDPKTRVWTVLASMVTPRRYHSTALLLSSGNVLVAGGGQGGAPVQPSFPNGVVDRPSAEVYSPPYLFLPDGSPAPRPVGRMPSPFPAVRDRRLVRLLEKTSGRLVVFACRRWGAW
jgi:hypothetical protein